MTLSLLKSHRRVYVATPYTKYELGIQEAWKHAVEVSGRLLRGGVSVYSPIVHCHPIALMCGIDPLDLAIWLPNNQTQLDDADALAVILMEGWGESTGVREEIKDFQKKGKPIYAVHPVTLEVSPYSKPAPTTLELTPLEQAIADYKQECSHEAVTVDGDRSHHCKKCGQEIASQARAA